MDKTSKIFMDFAIEYAKEGMHKSKGGPFGAVVVKDGKIIGKGHNRVATENDPTAHAEVVAIRDACKHIGSYQLTGCILYTTCEPCPMCLGAIYWSRPLKVVFGSTKKDAAETGFDDAFIYEEIDKTMPNRKIPFVQEFRKEALQLFVEWNTLDEKIQY